MIQCDDDTESTEPKSIRDLRPHLIKNIINRLDYKSIKGIRSTNVLNVSEMNLREWLRHRILQIKKSYNEFSYDHIFGPPSGEFTIHGETFIIFGKNDSVQTFFKDFGHQVTRIEINTMDPSELRYRSPHPYDFIKSAKDLEELRIANIRDKEIWKDLSFFSQNEILFPKVKKFQYEGVWYRNGFKLGLIFPELESVKLIGTIMDENCLADVKTLKELELRTASIKKDQLISILANNPNLEKILLVEPAESAIMEAIAKYSTNLKSLTVIDPLGNFLFQTSDRSSNSLPSVMNFTILSEDFGDISGKPSFQMPQLRQLRLVGKGIDTPIINFIGHFERLRRIELISLEYIEDLYELGLRNIPGLVMGDVTDRGMKNIKKELEDSTWTLSQHGGNDMRQSLVIER